MHASIRDFLSVHIDVVGSYKFTYLMAKRSDDLGQQIGGCGQDSGLYRRNLNGRKLEDHDGKGDLMSSSFL